MYTICVYIVHQFQFLRSTIGWHHWQQVWEATHTTASFNQSPSTRAPTQKCQVKQLRTLNCQTGINLVHRPHVAFIVHTICTIWCCVWPALWQCTLCTDWRSLGMPTRNIKRGNYIHKSAWKSDLKWCCRATGSNLRMVRPSLMMVVKLPIIRAQSAPQNFGPSYIF